MSVFRRLLAHLFAACVGLSCAGETAPEARSNVLLIVVDTLRRDHVGSYGYERGVTPHIDRLASDSVRYENAYSQAPWTTPSVGALLASRYPSMLGIKSDRSILPDSLVMLPEVLRDAGWTTGAVVSHDFCSSEWGFAQGFDFFDEENIFGHVGASSPGVTEKALGFIAKHAGEPFFLWLHYFDPHNEYLIHQGFGYRRSRRYRGPVDGRNSFHGLREVADSLGPADWAEMRRRYDSEIAFTDHHIGRVLERLRELDLYDDTLVIFTSDHGEEFGDHGFMGHAHTLYQELVHVPLLIKFPGEKPRVTEEPAALVDIHPTVLDVLGLEASPGAVGRSLLGPDGGSAAGNRVLFTETSRNGVLRAAIAGRYKLVKNLEDGRFALYDLENDASERTDLSAEIESLQPGLRPVLEEWVRRMSESEPEALERELSAAEIEQLKSLGYGD